MNVGVTAVYNTMEGMKIPSAKTITFCDIFVMKFAILYSQTTEIA